MQDIIMITSLLSAFFSLLALIMDRKLGAIWLMLFSCYFLLLILVKPIINEVVK